MYLPAISRIHVAKLPGQIFTNLFFSLSTTGRVSVCPRHTETQEAGDIQGSGIPDPVRLPDWREQPQHRVQRQHPDHRRHHRQHRSTPDLHHEDLQLKRRRHLPSRNRRLPHAQGKIQ